MSAARAIVHKALLHEKGRAMYAPLDHMPSLAVMAGLGSQRGAKHAAIERSMAMRLPRGMERRLW
jgi:hypothetical protein